MRDVLDAAYWRSEDVFISLYLRDVAKSREDGIFGMPAVMAAGGVHFVFSLMVSGVCFEGFFFLYIFVVSHLLAVGIQQMCRNGMYVKII
jgi:hypothetical protein